MFHTKIHRHLCTGLLLALSSSWAMAEQTEAAPSPTIVEVAVGDTIKVSRLPEGIYLRDINDPDDTVWGRIPAYRIKLDAAPPVHASTELRYDPNAGGHVNFQLARTSERFYVRMHWADPSENRNESVSEFSDGAAIQFALHGQDTNFMMGTDADQPVNIWYWRANQDAIQNLAAGGYGSTTLLPEQPVSGQAAYFSSKSHEHKRWQVVMSRPLEANGKHQVELDTGTVPVSFAVWQGEDEQRDGNKRVTLGWLMVNLDPDT